MKCACICNHSRSSDVCREEPFCLPKWGKKKKAFSVSLSICSWPGFCLDPFNCLSNALWSVSFVFCCPHLLSLCIDDVVKENFREKKTGDLPPTSNSFSTFEQLFHCQLEETRRRLWNLCYNLLNEWNHFANLLDRRALSLRRHDVGILMALWIGRVWDFNG